MKPAALASRIQHVLSDNPRFKGVVAFQPATGQVLWNPRLEPVTGRSDTIFPTEPSHAMLAAWIAFQWLPAVQVEHQSGFRDHTGGGGYGINVRPNAAVWMFRDDLGRIHLTHVDPEAIADYATVSADMAG